MAELGKATVKLGGITLAGNSTITWRLQVGVAPYSTTFSVHRTHWQRLRQKMGQDIDLEITDGRGVKTTFRRVAILHEVPSDSPNRISFLVADCRWRWQYKLVARDYNVSKKTGTRFVPAGQTGPIEIQVTADEFAYRAYSLKGGNRRWTAEDAIKDVLLLLEGDASKFRIGSWPVRESVSGNAQFSMQNVVLRDNGDAAVSRLLSYVPGAELYVAPDGVITVFDGADLEATKSFHQSLPPNTWDGDRARIIERKKIRPREIVVHYQREVECLFEFQDAYSGTTTGLDRTRPYLENVLPTVDPSTTLTIRNPETGESKTVDVRQGTWVPVAQWLEAMDADRPTGSMPWTFDTIAAHWFKGDLEAVLGARVDTSETANVQWRVQALRQHFRQTFRISPRIVERCRDLLDVRVALLDPVTGARAPAHVWGQCCIVPSGKYRIMPRRDGQPSGLFRNVDNYPAAGDTVKEKPPSAAEVSWVDEDQGIFRVDYLTSFAGTDAQILPCHLVSGNGALAVPSGNLEDQDQEPMGGGMRIEGGTNGIFLDPSMRMAVMLTIVPAAPNNRWQFHRIRVEGSDVEEVFQREFGIADGDGPPLHLWIPPGETTARFAWDDDQFASDTIGDLLGLSSADPTAAGIDSEDELPGFVCVNDENELRPHAKSVAAEMLAAYADSLMGRVTTRPIENLRLVGNMAGTSLQVSAYPSAKVTAIHDFPGSQRPVSRFSVLPQSARELILGVLPYKGKG